MHSIERRSHARLRKQLINLHPKRQMAETVREEPLVPLHYVLLENRKPTAQTRITFLGQTCRAFSWKTACKRLHHSNLRLRANSGKTKQLLALRESMWSHRNKTSEASATSMQLLKLLRSTDTSLDELRYTENITAAGCLVDESCVSLEKTAL